MKRSIIIAIVLGLLCLNASSANESDIKPYYVIEFKAFNCSFDIRVNDISILTLDVKGQVATIIPVNNAILETGKQQVTYHILPLQGETALRENAEFSATVWLYDAGGAHIEEVESIDNTSFSMPKNESENLLQSYKGEITFEAIVPYRLNAWQNSADLTKIENLRTMVEAAYRKIEALISNGQYEAFAALLQQREDNMATCMYMSEEEKKERVTDLISTIKEHNLKVVPVSESDIMTFYGYGKIVTLLRPDGESALLLRAEDGREINLIIQFHLEQGSEELTVI